MMSTRSAVPVQTSAFDAAAVRQDFPILRQRVRNKPLVYLDNAATTQKPQMVIDRVVRYYAQENANVHRGVHWLSERDRYLTGIGWERIAIHERELLQYAARALSR